MHRCKIPCITAESGTPYPVRGEDVKFHYEGIMNVMRYLGILEGKPRIKDLRVNPPMERLFAEHGGIWHRKVKVGQRVKKEMVLGEILNLFLHTFYVRI